MVSSSNGRAEPHTACESRPPIALDHLTPSANEGRRYPIAGHPPVNHSPSSMAGYASTAKPAASRMGKWAVVLVRMAVRNGRPAVAAAVPVRSFLDTPDLNADAPHSSM
jgi:hypothetical protein